MGKSFAMTRRSTRTGARTSSIPDDVELESCARKRKSLTEDENENPAQRQKLAFLTNQLDLEVEMRCQRLRNTSKGYIQTMNSELEVSLMRLPRHIREMSIGQFKVKYQAARRECYQTT